MQYVVLLPFSERLLLQLVWQLKLWLQRRHAPSLRHQLWLLHLRQLYVLPQHLPWLLHLLQLCVLLLHWLRVDVFLPLLLFSGLRLLYDVQHLLQHVLWHRLELLLWRQLLVEHVLRRVLVELLSVQLLVFVALQFVWLRQQGL